MRGEEKSGHLYYQKLLLDPGFLSLVSHAPTYSPTYFPFQWNSVQFFLTQARLPIFHMKNFTVVPICFLFSACSEGNAFDP